MHTHAHDPRYRFRTSDRNHSRLVQQASTFFLYTWQVTGEKFIKNGSSLFALVVVFSDAINLT